MRIALAYCYPNLQAAKYAPAAKRFADTYQAFPPGKSEHELYVIANGAPLEPHQKKPFIHIANKYLEHNNYGKDVGAFQMAAREIKCDLLGCFGAHIYFWKAGWLDRIVEAYLENGPGLYGTWGFHQPLPHLRTTAFWIPPEVLDTYPHAIGDSDRYSFEHGLDSLTLWAQRTGFEPLLVTWSGVFAMDQWHPVSREESLFYDQWYDGRGGP